MAFHFSKRKLKPHEGDEMGELNIIPYLDILMNLIIFMLLSMTGLATFGILNVNAPSYGGGAGASDTPQAPELLLTVGISKKGFYVAAQGGVLPGQTEGQTGVPGEGAPTVPVNADGTFNYQGLNDKMKEVKTAVADMIRENKVAPTSDSKVIIAAEADTAYEVLVGAMDATRETKDRKLLFPDVTLASF